MKKMSVKRWDSIVESDYADHAAWASIYEPDNLDAVAALGIDVVELQRCATELGEAEDVAFSLPAAGASLPLMRLRVSAQILTPRGRKLIGWRSSTCLSVFCDGKQFLFNRALPDLSRKNAAALAFAIHEPAVFPLKVYLPALQRHESFAIDYE
jgi:hypothetical protein